MPNAFRPHASTPRKMQPRAPGVARHVVLICCSFSCVQALNLARLGYKLHRLETACAPLFLPKTKALNTHHFEPTFNNNSKHTTTPPDERRDRVQRALAARRQGVHLRHGRVDAGRGARRRLGPAVRAKPLLLRRATRRALGAQRGLLRRQRRGWCWCCSGRIAGGRARQTAVIAHPHTRQTH